MDTGLWDDFMRWVMRNIVLALLLILCPLVFAQNPGIVIVGTAPSGSCSQGSPGRLVNSTGKVWTCQGITAGTGTWTEETGGGGSGTVNAGTAGQSAFYPAGAAAVSGTSAVLYDGSGNLQSTTAFTPNTAGTGVDNRGFTGADGTSRIFRQFVNQNTSSGGAGNTTHVWNEYVGSTSFVNAINNYFWHGWNIAPGGGKANAADSINAEGWEDTYCPSGTPGGVWPPTAQGQCQDEHHWTSAGINWPFAQVRNLTMASDTLTGTTDFWTWSSDSGELWKYAVNDGNMLSGVTATMSGTTATFTYASGFPFDYTVGSYIMVGCAVVGTPSCSNMAPAGYNTLWLITGTSGSPGTNCAGATTCTGTAYSGVSGLGSGSGGKVYGLAGGYAGLTSLAGGGAYNIGGFYTSGPLGIGAGGAMVENGALNSTAGMSLGSESGLSGGSATGFVTLHAAGISGITPGTTACSIAGTIYFTASGGNEYFTCDGFHWQSPGSYNLSAGLGLQKSGSLALAVSSWFNGSVSGGLIIGTNGSTAANQGGLWVTSNGGGAILYDICDQQGSGFTALTDCLMGGWSGIKTRIVDGSNNMIQGDGSGNATFAGSGSFNGGLNFNSHAGVTAGSFSAITAIAANSGGVITLTGTSDSRLKTNIKPYDRGIEAIMALHPALYHWNEAGQKITGFPADLEQAGFIAQDVQKSIPEAVGIEPHDGVDYLNLSDRPIVAALVNAVQEQQAQIDALKAEVAALKANATIAIAPGDTPTYQLLWGNAALKAAH
jgi:hypothetical protein